MWPNCHRPARRLGIVARIPVEALSRLYWLDAGNRQAFPSILPHDNLTRLPFRSPAASFSAEPVRAQFGTAQSAE